MQVAVVYYGIKGLNSFTDSFYKAETTVETAPLFLRFDERPLASEWPLSARGGGEKAKQR